MVALLNGAAVWGANAAEMSARYPCDRVAPDPAAAWFRAVTVHAPRSVVFRWLCQLKVAPYSYDLLDNAGRRSPRALTPGVERLASGQRVMSIFQLVDFEQDAQLTIRLTAPRALALFGPLAGTYAVRELDATHSRLVVKLNVGLRGDNLLHRVRRWGLAWGDLFMMHRQLTTLPQLAEATAAQRHRARTGTGRGARACRRTAPTCVAGQRPHFHIRGQAGRGRRGSHYKPDRSGHRGVRRRPSRCVRTAARHRHGDIHERRLGKLVSGTASTWSGSGDALPRPRPDERWFGLLTDKRLRRSAHRSIQALERDIRAWIDHWNRDPKPFTWTKTADEILDRLAAYLQRIPGAGH